MITTRPGEARATWSVGFRTALWAALIVAEMLVVSVLFDFAAGLPDHLNPVFYATRTVRWIAVSVPVFLLLVWPERLALAAAWAKLELRHGASRALAVNLALFALLAIGCALFTPYAAAAASPPWHLLALLGLLLGATALSLLEIVVPLRGLAELGWVWRGPLAAAAAVGLAIVVLADAALLLWGDLAGATLTLSAAMLRLYEPDVVVDTVERTLRVGDFGVVIWDTCSGVEGLALVAGFVTIYLWAFRAELRFPAALWLYPVGLGASWVLNSARIAALTSIGAHVSPEMAVKGFHSQAGWIAFLMVTLGLMALSRRLGLLSRRSAPVATPAAPVRYEATVAHLLPFVALMLGSIAMATAAPHERPVYLLKVALVAGALWMCRHSYGAWTLRFSGTAVGAGLLVGVAWIATDPAPDAGGALADWLAALGPGLAALWLAARGFGAIVLVPIAEELAFRGFLYRRMMARNFFDVPASRLSWIALAVSSAMFGVLHDRWLAAALAGGVFAIVMLRSGRLGDAIVAHAAANALIFGWALAFRQWSLL